MAGNGSLEPEALAEQSLMEKAEAVYHKMAFGQPWQNPDYVPEEETREILTDELLELFEQYEEGIPE